MSLQRTPCVSPWESSELLRARRARKAGKAGKEARAEAKAEAKGLLTRMNTDRLRIKADEGMSACVRHCDRSCNGIHTLAASQGTGKTGETGEKGKTGGTGEIGGKRGKKGKREGEAPTALLVEGAT